MSADHSNAPLVELLTQRGYTEVEIAKILKHLAKRDERTNADSVFDSIGQGSLSFDDIIRQALES